MDVPALLAAMEAIQKGARQEDRRSRPGPHQAPKPTQVFQYVSRYEGLDEGLPFLVGARQRIKLPEGDLGPRSVVMAGQTAYVANYFSDTLTEIDLSGPEPRVESIPLGPRRDMDMVRRGELYFHDATLCLEGWQSCASCHPDGGADGFNWDLLNDGIGNPKNTKSLLLAHRTPPAMFSGIRADAETAVRSGIKHILFTDQPEPVAQAIDEYLKSLQPTPSPHLVDGKLSAAALRGQKVFGKAGCAECHPPKAFFTDLESYDVGTRRGYEKPGERFDVPSLIELWRTAPYLHDGSAATVRDVLTTRNRNDQHGSTSQWSPEEIDDLCAYLLSL
jgi:cytochrome c peroxidase